MTYWEHKFDDWETRSIESEHDCISTQIIFSVQWSNCPVEVEEEVVRLWQECELRNGSYFDWDRSAEHHIERDDEDYEMSLAEHYPVIDGYLQSRGVSKCLIYWWW